MDYRIVKKSSGQGKDLFDEINDEDERFIPPKVETYEDYTDE